MRAHFLFGCVVAAMGAATSAFGQCGAGGDCFQTHGPGCNDGDCCNAVCAVDSFCCNNSWDSVCVGEANNFCVSNVVSGPFTNPVNHNQYYVLDNATWQKSQDKAASLGGHLVTISNAAENAWVLATATANGSPNTYFIGINDLTTEGTWVWVNGEAVNYTNWAAGEPNNSGNEDVGTVLDATGVWNDVKTSTTRFAVAEVEVYFCGDPDAGSCTAAHSSPNCADADCCNLVCSIDPFCCNNQWDSLCAGEGAWCSPTVVAGPFVDPLTGREHARLSKSFASSARAFAVANGGDLVSIHSGFENEWLRDNVASNVPTLANSPMIIGINDVAAEGTFVWSDGSPVNFVNWFPGEPNNSGGNEDAAVLDSGAGRWNDVPVTSATGAITESGFGICGGSGSCYTTHGPGCNDVSCCNVVCVFDPFCCNSNWDSFCVNEANNFCEPPVIHGPVVNPATKHRYYVLDTGEWSQAERAAIALGGHLAVPNTPAENTWIKLNMRNGFAGVTDAFIGVSDQAIEGTFVAITHEAIAASWAPGEPNNSGNGEDFTTMLADGNWNDLDRYIAQMAIIEVPCIGDLDASGTVDASDLAVVLGAWGGTVGAADLNHDGRIDAADLAVLLGSWGPCAVSNACFQHGAGSDQPACTACVCNLDPFCCNNQWDALCVSEAGGVCNNACQCTGG